MCGIAGFWAPGTSAGDELLHSQALGMARAISHRGPDNQAAWSDSDAGLGLGHARLSIIDLSAAANQPLSYLDGRYTLVYNGEIYNYQELAENLRSAGYSFRTSSDTEVIPAAVHAWGLVGAIKRFLGIFAFALWDASTRKLHLVRDNIGIKPLYYGVANGILLFGSSLKALFAHPQFPRELDATSLADYMRYSYVPRSRSIFRAVRKLPPGHVLTIDQGLNTSLECYWNLLNEASKARRNLYQGSAATIFDAFHSLALDAVKRQLVSDVPLGAFLSGGIDSSLVAALMQEASPGRVKTFTIGFEDPRFDESSYAREVARHLGTDHVEMPCTATDALHVIPQLPHFFDEPFADSSQIPTLLLARLTRGHVTVALSGDGGDELFAGYDRYYWMYWLRQRKQRMPNYLARFFSRMASKFPRERTFPLIQRWAREPTRHIERADRFYHLTRMADHFCDYKYLYRTTPYTVATMRDNQILRDEIESQGPLDDPIARSEFPDLIDWMQLMDQETYLVEDILQKVDRATMAVGLEARVPLLDRRLIEFSWRVPQSLKINGQRGKLAMRSVLYRYVPRSLVDRPKRGFSIPLGDWLKGPLREWVESMLAPRLLERDGLLDPIGVRNCWEAFLTGRAEHTQTTVWALLMFLAWRDRHGY